MPVGESVCAGMISKQESSPVNGIATPFPFAQDRRPTRRALMMSGPGHANVPPEVYALKFQVEHSQIGL